MGRRGGYAPGFGESGGRCVRDGGDHSDMDYRKRLLITLHRLDEMRTDAETNLDGPAYTENLPLAKELCKLLADMRVKVEEKLDQEHR
jgi:hypothetical protein